MSIESALQTALSGLQATQAQIQVISGNVANVQTPGYSREILPQETVVTSVATSVETGAVQRVVDQVLNTNLTNQTTATNAASTLETYYKQIDSLLGQVGSGASINQALDQFSSAMEAVATSPQDPVAQGAAVSAGKALAQTLNQLSTGIQSIRQGTDSAIATDVSTLNTALKSIATINSQVSQLQAEGQSTAALQDQRDQALQTVAQLIGVNSFVTADGSMMVISTSGQTLVDPIGAGTFSYTPAGNVIATTALSGIKLNGIDITSQITTGSLGALRQLRDTDLPGLTAQLNQFTNNLFNATAVTQSGTVFSTSGGSPATGDTFTATINGSTYSTLALPANPTLSDIANALTTQFKARASVAVSGGAPVAGDVFSTTIDGTPYNTTALAGGGPFTSTDIVNALNSTLTAINVPVTVGTSVAGDKLDVTLNGTTYTTAALPAAATIAQMATAIQAAIPAGFTATVSGGNIQISDTTGILKTAAIALHTGGTGTETFSAGVQTSTFSASLDSGGNIVVADSTGSPISLSLSKLSGTGTETFAPAVLTTLSASVSGGNLVITDTSGQPMTAALATNSIFTAGTPVVGTPSTIDFTQTSGSLNVGQTYDVVVDGTDYGSTAALTTGSTALTDVATAIQHVFTAKGVAFTASIVGGKIRISDPAGAALTASLTLTAGPGSEAFTVQTTTNPLNTLNSGLGATNDKNHFFAAVDLTSGIDNSATIQVNPSLLANTSLLLQAATGPDPSISQNLFANLGANYTFAAAGAFTNSTTTSLGNYSGQIIGQAASTAAAASSNSTFQAQLQSQLATQAGSVSGVNIDEELSNLIQYQNTYSANAKVLTVVQTLYDTLMKM
jgi:flagellar hook-associated protein 1 FlgK